MTLCIGMLFLNGCTEEEKIEKAPASADTYFPLRIGETNLRVQLALNPSEQRRGLMFRDKLGANDGMLFLFPKPDRRGFWMKNTKLPLDIGYFDTEGQLVEVHPLFPYDETPVPSSSDHILIAIETNRGWFKANRVRPGARINLEQLEDAVQARGGRHLLLAK